MTPSPYAQVLHLIAEGHTEFRIKDEKGTYHARTAKQILMLVSSGNAGNADAYELAPRSIKIGDVEVPAPLRAAPEQGATYWLIDLDEVDRVRKCAWSATDYAQRRLALGLIHLDRKAAQDHAEALLSFSKANP